MTLLDKFAESHPLATGACGGIGALCSLIFKALHVVAGVAADLGMIAAAAAILSFVLLYCRNRDHGRRLDHHARHAEFPDDDLTYKFMNSLESFLGANWRTTLSGWITILATAIAAKPNLVSFLPASWTRPMAPAATFERG